MSGYYAAQRTAGGDPLPAVHRPPPADSLHAAAAYACASSASAAERSADARRSLAVVTPLAQEQPVFLQILAATHLRLGDRGLAMTCGEDRAFRAILDRIFA